MKHLAALLCLIAAPAFAHNERYYQDLWCGSVQGRTEVVMADRTRVDCLTDEYAIEFDWANKWAEAIGQSLGYSQLTGKKAGIVLIVRKERDQKYVDKLSSVIEHYGLPITVWVTN